MKLEIETTYEISVVYSNNFDLIKIHFVWLKYYNFYIKLSRSTYFDDGKWEQAMEWMTFEKRLLESTEIREEEWCWRVKKWKKKNEK